MDYGRVGSGLGNLKRSTTLIHFSGSLRCIDAWMLTNMLKLNREKTELLVFGPKHKALPAIVGVHVAGEYIKVSSSARNIAVIFNSHINLEKHVMNTCKIALFHLRNIAKIRNCLSQNEAEILVHAFISSKLYFCNALLYGLPQSVLDKLLYVLLAWCPELLAQNILHQHFVNLTN